MPQGPVPGTAPGRGSAWVALVGELAERLGALEDGAALVIRAPQSLARPVPSATGGILRRLLAPAYVDTAPWIRVRREEDHLRGWCVGPGERGRGFPLSAQEQEEILTVGWHRPGPLEGTDFLRWWPDDVATGPYLPPAQALAAATLVLRTLHDVFGVPDAGAVEVVADPS
jgi:hypothetical protein